MKVHKNVKILLTEKRIENNYSPALIGGGGAILDFGLSIILSLSCNFISAQYLENKLTICLPYFVYVLILTRSRLGLLHIIFCTFVIELWPLTDVRISFRILFPFNILRTN